MDELDQQDEAVIAQLRDALRADVVPPSVTEAAKAALSWRRIDAELAELLSDSALDDSAALAIARGGGSALVRSVSFGAGATIVDVEIRPDGLRRRLLGQLSPAGVRTIEVQYAVGSDPEPVRSDALGRFRIGLENGGMLRLRIVDDAGAAVETSWIPI